MTIRYGTRSVEILVNGEKVDDSDVAVHYGQPRPKLTIADYLACRERALEIMAWWLANPELEMPRPYPCRSGLALWCARYGLHNWLTTSLYGPPPRDKRPLPLP